MATQAFSEGNYQKAAESFLALTQTDDSSEVRYNLAICYFKLEQWREAQKLLLDLVREHPEDDLISYNLAITEKKLGNTISAKKRFASLSLKSLDEEILQLSRRQLKNLPQTDNQFLGNEGSGKWSIGAKAQMGSYDNLLTPSREENSGISDSIFETQLYFRWQDNEHSNDRWLVTAFVYQSEYEKTKDYNARFAKIDVRKYFPITNGYIHTGVAIDSSQLDHSGYLQNVSADIGAIKRLGQSSYWSANYHYRDISSLGDEYNVFDGNLQKLKLALGRHPSATWDWELNYQVIDENRQDSNQAPFFFRSYSPIRHSIGGRVRLYLGNFELGLNLDYRDSNYRKENSDFGIVNTLRKDNNIKARLKLEWSLSPQWSATAEYGYTDNDSTISTYIYDQQVIKVGLSWQL
ncbi:hypothetical protein NBRC116587_32330 [Pseudoteredinibacter isoporae]